MSSGCARWKTNSSPAEAAARPAQSALSPERSGQPRKAQARCMAYTRHWARAFAKRPKVIRTHTDVVVHLNNC